MKALLLGFFLCAWPAMAKVSEVRILSRVAGSVVTDRRVMMNLFLEDPVLYVPGERRQAVGKDVFEQAYQRLLTEIMASEENRIVGLLQVSDTEVDEFLASWRKSLGPNWKRFLMDFEVTEADLRPAISDKLVLRKSLTAKVRAATKPVEAARTQQNPQNPKTRLAGDELARAAIDEWVKQLKSRYRVQAFKDETFSDER